MTHRASQIVEAIASALRVRAEPNGIHVYTHRRESLAAEQDELPAISVDFGDDEPTEGYLSSVDSGLMVVVTIIVKATRTEDVRALLLDWRDVSDDVMETARLSPDGQKLGLSFVNGIRYGGASAPDINPEGEQHSGALECRWTIDYRLRG